tara:strand:+ start:25537 stop:25899 length:363 start_codon:yes stop_codon:yes gene_type:complete
VISLLSESITVGVLEYPTCFSSADAASSPVRAIYAKGLGIGNLCVVPKVILEGFVNRLRAETVVAERVVAETVVADRAWPIEEANVAKEDAPVPPLSIASTSESAKIFKELGVLDVSNAM